MKSEQEEVIAENIPYEGNYGRNVESVSKLKVGHSLWRETEQEAISLQVAGHRMGLVLRRMYREEKDRRTGKIKKGFRVWNMGKKKVKTTRRRKARAS